MGEKPAFVVGTPVYAVSRSEGKLDVFATSATGEIYTAAWEPDLAGDAGLPTGWRGWWPIVGGAAVAGAPVTVVSRSADKLDVFAAGSDGVVYTAAWEPDARWTAWRPIAGITVAAGSTVTCVSRSADLLDIFVTDTGGAVQTSAWEPSFGAKWSAWRQVAGGVVPAGSMVAAVSRAADHLDVFIVDGAGAVQTSSWEPSFGEKWSEWRQVATGVAPPGAPVTAVARAADHLDVFVTDGAGAVQTSAWEPSFEANWSEWRPIANGVVPPGAQITAVSRAGDHLDVFVVDGAGAVQTSSWEPSFGANWSDWRQIADGSAPVAAAVDAVSRAADHLDVFVIGNDGRVQTAAWKPAFGTTWRGWWPIG